MKNKLLLATVASGLFTLSVNTIPLVKAADNEGENQNAQGQNNNVHIHHPVAQEVPEENVNQGDQGAAQGQNNNVHHADIPEAPVTPIVAEEEADQDDQNAAQDQNNNVHIHNPAQEVPAENAEQTEEPEVPIVVQQDGEDEIGGQQEGEEEGENQNAQDQNNNVPIHNLAQEVSAENADQTEEGTVPIVVQQDGGVEDEISDQQGSEEEGEDEISDQQGNEEEGEGETQNTEPEIIAAGDGQTITIDDQVVISGNGNGAEEEGEEQEAGENKEPSVLGNEEARLESKNELIKQQKEIVREANEDIVVQQELVKETTESIAVTEELRTLIERNTSLLDKQITDLEEQKTTKEEEINTGQESLQEKSNSIVQIEENIAAIETTISELTETKTLAEEEEAAANTALQTALEEAGNAPTDEQKAQLEVLRLQLDEKQLQLEDAVKELGTSQTTKQGFDKNLETERKNIEELSKQIENTQSRIDSIVQEKEKIELKKSENSEEDTQYSEDVEGLERELRKVNNILGRAKRKKEEAQNKLAEAEATAASTQDIIEKYLEPEAELVKEITVVRKELEQILDDSSIKDEELKTIYEEVKTSLKNLERITGKNTGEDDRNDVKESLEENISSLSESVYGVIDSEPDSVILAKTINLLVKAHKHHNGIVLDESIKLKKTYETTSEDVTPEEIAEVEKRIEDLQKEHNKFLKNLQERLLLISSDKDATQNNSYTKTANAASEGAMNSMAEVTTIIDNKIMNTSPAAGEFDESFGVWVKGARGTSKQDPRDLARGYEATGSTIAMGLDIGDDDFLAGIAVTYLSKEIKDKVATNDLDQVNSYILNLYGKYMITPELFLSSQLNIGSGTVDKTEMLGGVKATAKPDMKIFAGKANIHYALPLSPGLSLTPTVGAVYKQVNIDAYKIADADDTVSRNIGKNEIVRISGILGADLTYKADLGNGVKLVPGVAGYIDYAFKNELTDTKVNLFNLDEDTVTISTTNPEKLNYTVGTSLKVIYSNMYEIGGGYSFNGAKGYTSHTGMIKLRLNF